MIALNEVSVLGALEWSGVSDGAVSGASVGVSSCFIRSISLAIRDVIARVIHQTIVLLPLIFSVQSASAKDIDDRFMDVVVAIADAHDLTNKESVFSIISQNTDLKIEIDKTYDEGGGKESVKLGTNSGYGGVQILYSSHRLKSDKGAKIILCYCGEWAGDEKKIIDFMGKRFLDITYRDGLNLQIDKKYLLLSNDNIELSASIIGNMAFGNKARMIIINQVQKK